MLILGGGVGGLVAANELKDKLGDKVDVTLIDKKSRFEFAPLFLWLLLGKRKPEQISKDLSLLKSKGIEVVNDTIVSIDTSSKRVKTEYNEFQYD